MSQNSKPSSEKFATNLFPNYLFWEQLIITLSTHDFSISIDHMLRMESLLRSVPLKTPAYELKYILAPIFATNLTQQEKFYKIFDDFLAAYPRSVAKTQPKKNSLAKILIAFTGLFIMSFCLVIAFFTIKSPVKFIDQLLTNSSSNKPVPISSNTPSPSPTTSPIPTSTPPSPTASPLINNTNKPKITRINRTSSVGDNYKWVVFSFITLLTVGHIVFRNYYMPYEKKRSPPFRWPLHATTNLQSPHDTSEIQQVALRMRTRQNIEVTKFDINNSIDRTITGGGFPELSYRFVTRRPEYIVLINRHNTNDHLAEFYSELIRVLQMDGVHITSYFFDADIRFCQPEKNSRVLTLEQITSRYGSTHHLLIISEVRYLIDPMSNAIPSWMWKVLSKWENRTCFIPTRFSRVDSEERQFSLLIPVYPANIDGLSQFLGVPLGQKVPVSSPIGIEELNQAPYLSPNVSPDQISNLRRYLGKSGFQWLCTCSLYPELNWDLTLQLGRISTLPNDTFTRDNLLLLSSLSWFRKGAIPEVWRSELIRQLPEEVALQARQTIVRILFQQENVPPPGSYASEIFLLERALQSWTASPDVENREVLNELLAKMHPGDISNQTVLVNLLQNEKPRNIFHSVTRAWQTLSYEHGIPEMGVRVLFFGLFAGVAAMFGAIFASFTIMAIAVSAYMSRNVIPDPNPVTLSETPRRILAIFGIFSIICVSLVSKLFYIQVIQHQRYVAEAKILRGKTIRLYAPRGELLDRNGALLVTNEPAATIVVDPNMWGADLNKRTGETFESRKESALSRLQTLLPNVKVQAEVEKRAGQPVRVASGKIRYRTVDLARRVPMYLGEAVKTAVKEHGIVGVGVLPDTVRKAIDGNLAPQVIGFTGQEGNGLDGLEKTLDPDLDGKNGYFTAEFNKAMVPIPGTEYKRVNPRPGSDIVLTLDSALQQDVETALNKVFVSSHADSAVAIVLDPKTGDVLAMANRPTYNANQRELRSYGRTNQCVSAPYEPGAALSTITMVAALEEKIIAPNSPFYCSGSMNIGRRTIHCTQKHGFQTATDILANSCTTGTAQFAFQIGKNKLYNYEKLFGFGEKSRAGFPGESRGILAKPDLWSDIQLANIGFGQGISVTPLQLAAAYGAIANGGTYLPPRIVWGVRNQNTDNLKAFEVSKGRRIMSSETSRQMIRMLQKVVNNGTGSKAELSSWTAGGKTGTAQIAQNGYYSNKHVASFVGMTPIDDPKYVILVAVTAPKGEYFGGIVAGPVFKEIAEKTITRWQGSKTRILPHF